MSGARKRGLVRLAVLLGFVGLLVVLAARGSFRRRSHTHVRPRSRGHPEPSPAARLKAERSSMRLPQPLHGATAAPTGEGLLVIGGADRSDVSLDQVLLLDPRANRVSRAGALTSPLHDAAAATVGDRTLVFGGGASTTYDTVQELVAGGSARQIGHLPVGASDLSAVTSGGGVVYVLGGYDGQRPVASVYRTGDGRSFTKSGRAADRRSLHGGCGARRPDLHLRWGAGKRGGHRRDPGVRRRAPGEPQSSATCRRASTTPRRLC